MNQLLLLMGVLVSLSCGQNADPIKTQRSSSLDRSKQHDQMQVKNALQFINSYVDNCNKLKESVAMKEWVNASNLTTNRFKTELKSLVDKAIQEDPEAGLGFDPILNAQDYPDKGFELESFDHNTNYIVLKGKDWAEYKFTIKMVLENGHWLVDGCGIINIPKNKENER
jgi:hypothetical protein